jgi:hypothetical protein
MRRWGPTVAGRDVLTLEDLLSFEARYAGTSE